MPKKMQPATKKNSAKELQELNAYPNAQSSFVCEEASRTDLEGSATHSPIPPVCRLFQSWTKQEQQ